MRTLRTSVAGEEATEGVRAVYEPCMEQAIRGKTRREDLMGTNYERFSSRESPRRFRCRIGLHFWGGWIREMKRVYRPDAGCGEGAIVFTLYQWRRCYACAEGDGAAKIDVLCSGTLTPTQALWRGFITDAERQVLSARPLPDLNVGIRLDAEDNMGGDRFGPGREGAFIDPRCRFGFHLYLRHCCLRCGHLGSAYRSWDSFFTGRVS
jgi:hypothetical protein